MDTGDVATWAGALIAFPGLFVALASLIGSGRTSRLEHMHMLFKDYLRLQFDYNAAVGERNEQYKFLRGNLGGFKMYTFEEMTLWLRREQAWGRIYFWSRSHKDHIESWYATVRWHLDQCSVEDIADYEEALPCYGPDFRQEVSASLERRPLTSRSSAPRTSMDGTATMPPAV